MPNLFTAGQSDLSNPSGGYDWFQFSGGVNGYTQYDPTTYAVGNGSLKVYCDGSGSYETLGINIPIAYNFIPGQQYTLSVYLKSAGTDNTSVRFFAEFNNFRADNQNASTVQTLTLTTTWMRYSVTFTMPTSSTYYLIGLRIDTGNVVGQSTTLWVSGIQIEQGASATPWTLGVGSLGNPSDATPLHYKQQMVLVYSSSGTFLDVWRDAPLLSGVKYAINSATTPLRVQLPRAFDNFDEAGVGSNRGTIAQGNIVQYWLFGPNLPAGGLLKFQGVIDSYEPQILESGEESITVTITPFDSVLADEGLVLGQSFGTPGVTSSYVDPVTIFNWFFTNNDPLTGKPYMSPMTLDPNNPASSGNLVAYTFENQSIKSIYDTLITMLPANWFYRPNADKSMTLNVAPTTAQHQFILGQHIAVPQYRKDWTSLKNVTRVIGTGLATSLTSALVSGTQYTSLTIAPLPVAIVAGQQLVLNGNGSPQQTVTVSADTAQNATSVPVNSFTANAAYAAQTQVQILVQATAQGTDLSTFGARVLQLADSRLTDQHSCAVVAQGLLNQYDRMLVRTKLRIVDYRGDAQTGLGYDIESIQPGDTCQIVNPSANAANTLWDVSQWDIGYWDFSPAAALDQVAVIVSVSYRWDYVDLEIASLAPSQDVQLLNLQTMLQDYTLGR